MAKKKRPSVAKLDWIAEIKSEFKNVRIYNTTKKRILENLKYSTEAGDKVTLWKGRFRKVKAWKV
jgi:hypothetical protein